MPDKPKHRHTGHRERMKAEFLARGLEGWPDHRVLELLLFYTIPQGDVNDLAHELVERFGSLAGVLDEGAGDAQCGYVCGYGSDAYGPGERGVRPGLRRHRRDFKGSRL